MSGIEIFGTVLGVLGVWLTIRQNLWCWPVGIVQVALYAWIFFDAKLYSDAALQLVFLALQIYGWWHWTHGDPARRKELPVTRLSAMATIGWIVAGVVLTALHGEAMHRYTDAALPYWDAFILVFSLI